MARKQPVESLKLTKEMVAKSVREFAEVKFNEFPRKE